MTTQDPLGQFIYDTMFTPGGTNMYETIPDPDDACLKHGHLLDGMFCGCCGELRSHRMTTWLTVQDAADYVKVSADLIRRAVSMGDLPAYRISDGIGKGANYRLTADDLDAWMMSRTYEPRSSAS